VRWLPILFAALCRVRCSTALVQRRVFPEQPFNFFARLRENLLTMCRAVHWRGHSDRRSGHRNLGKDALFQIQELIQPLRGKDSPQEHARVQTPDPVDAPMALDKPHRVPWNIQIDDVAALLKIDALGEHVRSAPATNRMAFASRCEIQGRASRRHRLSACSKLSTPRNRALGLGLSVCRSTIEAHNGRLWVSPNLPRGAIFRFIVPAHDGVCGPAAAPDLETSVRGMIRRS
jgi:hypothetical protein